MSYIIINKDRFLEHLCNSSSYEEVISKIEEEKLRVDELLKDSGLYFPLARLHLGVIEEIEFYMQNGFSKSDRDDNLNGWLAKIFNKFQAKNNFEKILKGQKASAKKASAKKAAPKKSAKKASRKKATKK